MFPESEVSTIVRAVNEIQDLSTVVGLVGLGLLLWSSLGLFGALETAFNIVYGRPNRPFFRSKAVAAGLMIGLLVVLFAGLVVASFGQSQLSTSMPLEWPAAPSRPSSSRSPRHRSRRSPSSSSRTSC